MLLQGEARTHRLRCQFQGRWRRKKVRAYVESRETLRRSSNWSVRNLCHKSRCEFRGMHPRLMAKITDRPVIFAISLGANFAVCIRVRIAVGSVVEVYVAGHEVTSLSVQSERTESSIVALIEG